MADTAREVLYNLGFTEGLWNGMSEKGVLALADIPDLSSLYTPAGSGGVGSWTDTSFSTVAGETVTVATIAVPTSSPILILTEWMFYATQAGDSAVGDIDIYRKYHGYVNVAGTVSASTGTGGTDFELPLKFSAFSIQWPTMALVISGTNVLIQVTGYATRGFNHKVRYNTMTF